MVTLQSAASVAALLQEVLPLAIDILGDRFCALPGTIHFEGKLVTVVDSLPIPDRLGSGTPALVMRRRIMEGAVEAAVKVSSTIRTGITKSGTASLIVPYGTAAIALSNRLLHKNRPATFQLCRRPVILEDPLNRVKRLYLSRISFEASVAPAAE
jgi:hypothetical protein